MLLEHDGNKLRAFRMHRDSDVHTFGTRLGGLGEDSGVSELRVDWSHWTLSLTLWYAGLSA
jgi:hypothetical protein